MNNPFSCTHHPNGYSLLIKVSDPYDLLEAGAIDFLATLHHYINNINRYNASPREYLARYRILTQEIISSIMKILHITIAQPLGVLLDLLSMYAMLMNKKGLLDIIRHNWSRIAENHEMINIQRLLHYPPEQFIPASVLLFEITTGQRVPINIYQGITEEQYQRNLQYSPLVVANSKSEVIGPYLRYHLPSSVDPLPQRIDPWKTFWRLLEHIMEYPTNMRSIGGEHIPEKYQQIDKLLNRLFLDYYRIIKRPMNLIPLNSIKLGYPQILHLTESSSITINPTPGIFNHLAQLTSVIHQVLSYYSDQEIENSFFHPGYVENTHQLPKEQYTATIVLFWQKYQYNVIDINRLINSNIIQKWYRTQISANIITHFASIMSTGNYSRITKLWNIIRHVINYSHGDNLREYYNILRAVQYHQSTMLASILAIPVDLTEIIKQYAW